MSNHVTKVTGINYGLAIIASLYLKKSSQGVTCVITLNPIDRDSVF